MPSWNIHLAIAKKINKKLNLEKNSFYVGNLIADVDDNYNISSEETHYDNLVCKNCPTEKLPNIEAFLNDYKKVIKDNALLLGYYSHILTDYYYNNYVFSNCWVLDNNNRVIGIKLKNGKVLKNTPNNFIQRKEYKHYDFELYGKYLFNNNYVELPKYNKKISEDLKMLKKQFCSIEIIKNRINYLNNEFIKNSKYKLREKIFGLRYKMFNRKQLDNMFNDCIDFIIDNINKL